VADNAPNAIIAATIVMILSMQISSVKEWEAGLGAKRKTPGNSDGLFPRI
jgi:hypothetical protein